MNKYLMGISCLVVNKCRSAMLIPSMDISHLMVHSEQIKVQKLKKVGRYLKKTRAVDGKSSKTRFGVQDNQRFKKMFFNQVGYNTPRMNKRKGSTPKPQELKGNNPYVEKPMCAKCCRKHEGKCQVCTGNCCSFCKSGHMKRDFAMMKDQEREPNRAQASSPNADAPKKNRFYTSDLRVIKRILPMLLEVCYKYFPLMSIL